MRRTSSCLSDFFPTSFNGKVGKCRSVMLRTPLLLVAPRPRSALQGFPLTLSPFSRTKRLNLLERHLIATPPKGGQGKANFHPPSYSPLPWGYYDRDCVWPLGHAHRVIAPITYYRSMVCAVPLGARTHECDHPIPMGRACPPPLETPTLHNAMAG